MSWVDDFLKFEKKKLILPVLLVSLLCISLFSIHSIKYDCDDYKIGFKIIKAHIYFIYYNSTNQTNNAKAMEDIIDEYSEKLLKKNEEIKNSLSLYDTITSVLNFLGVRLKGCEEYSWLKINSNCYDFYGKDFYVCIKSTICNERYFIKEWGRALAGGTAEEFIRNHSIDTYENFCDINGIEEKVKKSYNPYTPIHFFAHVIYLFILGYLLSCIFVFVYKRIGLRK